MAEPPVFSLVVPARDEAACIGRTVNTVHEGLSREGIPTEIIIVDGRSTDGTRTKVESLARSIPRLRVIESPAPHGYGTAIRAGFAAASAAVVGYTDADLPADPKDIARAVCAVLDGNADCAVGARTARLEGGAYRRVQSAVWNALCRSVFGIRVADVNFSLKVLRRDRVEAMALRSRHIFIDAEILIESDRLGLRVVVIPCPQLARPAGRSRLGGPYSVVTMLAEASGHLLRTWRRGSLPAGRARAP